MDQFLTEADARVLGALIEKQVTTPDNYPLSMNALIAACNQTTNRYPVVSYDEDMVMGAIQRLRRASLVRGIQRIDARVIKYEHTAPDVLDLNQRELAVLCVLMLRGPNTVGELRTRTERLASFESTADLELTLQSLMDREKDPLVVRLPKRAGQKETRYAHLLSGEVSNEADDESNAVRMNVPAQTSSPSDDRIAALEQKVELLESEVRDMRTQLDEFRKQFE